MVTQLHQCGVSSHWYAIPALPSLQSPRRPPTARRDEVDGAGAKNADVPRLF